MSDTDPATIIVPLDSWNYYADEIRKMRDALEEIYDGAPAPALIAAKVLHRGAWA